ncbi:hypothetical protein PO909_017193 [Leuciscus waleckii]
MEMERLGRGGTKPSAGPNTLLKAALAVCVCVCIALLIAVITVSHTCLCVLVLRIMRLSPTGPGAGSCCGHLLSSCGLNHKHRPLKAMLV